MKIYLAATIGKPKGLYRTNAIKAKSILESLGHVVLAPWETKIPGAWEMSNIEWGKRVFDEDIKNIEAADCVVVLSYGRKSTAGANWEAGYAYGRGKKVLVVEMFGLKIMSLMVSNGANAVINGFEELKKYDFNDWPKKMTGTEQK